MYNNIIPECYIDTSLVNIILRIPNNKRVNHGKGITTVLKKMDNIFKDSFSIGIIDKDKRELRKINTDFTILNNTIPQYAILHKHKTKPHYLIQLCPVSETWICKVAKEVGINLVAEFSLPDNPILLCEITKKITSNYDERFIKLFKNILNKSEQINFEPVLKMKTWLTLLANDNYNVNNNELTE